MTRLMRQATEERIRQARREAAIDALLKLRSRAKPVVESARDVESAFGLVKTKRHVTPQDME